MDNGTGHVNSVIGDIRDYNLLKETFDIAKPEIVLHTVKHEYFFVVPYLATKLKLNEM